MIELVEGYKMTAKKISRFYSELDIQLANYKRERSNLLSFKSSEDFKYEEEKQNILSREKVLKNEVEIHTQQLLKDIGQSWKQIKSLTDADSESQKINKELEFRKESLTNALASVNTCDVFSAYKEELTSRQQRIEHANTLYRRLPQYVPGKMRILQSLHGELITSTDEYSPEQYEFKVIKQYKTGRVLVEILICCDDGTLWVGFVKDNIIQKIQFSNKLLNVVKEIQTSFVSMVPLPSGDLLISNAESNLKRLSHTTGKITHFKYSVAPLITGAVHVTGDGKIIVRTREKGPLFPVKGTRQVVVIDIQGRTENVYELDNNGKHIFSAPQRITTDTDNNIYVLDYLNEDCGRILALNKINGVKWIYNSDPDMNQKQTFKPSGLFAAKSDNIIIIDSKNQMIHILNSSGRCLHYLKTKDQLDIKLPFSVDMDNRGILYIGCNTKSREPDEAKIYTVQISGF
ncbi:uncharacterized protein LOC143069715 [Mytilus galloprovincialis]|uniref:uncharacterized protein LOC143069715 n=1 Tax=Mytilus galloprovincialis TaxID=29158 RepID=UPI003F7B826B